MVLRIGQGYDVHRLVPNRKLILAGIEVEHCYGLLGHSDADVLTHAIMDALLGAAALGDIGMHFPDSEAKYAGISSMVLLSEVILLIQSKGYSLVNVDSTIVAQKPKLSSYLSDMRYNLSRYLGVPIDCINLKATTEESLGFTGKEEGIAAHAVVLLKSL